MTHVTRALKETVDMRAQVLNRGSATYADVEDTTREPHPVHVEGHLCHELVAPRTVSRQ